MASSDNAIPPEPTPADAVCLPNGQSKKQIKNNVPNSPEVGFTPDEAEEHIIAAASVTRAISALSVKNKEKDVSTITEVNKDDDFNMPVSSCPSPNQGARPKGLKVRVPSAIKTPSHIGVNSSTERPLTDPDLDNEGQADAQRARDCPTEVMAENRGVNLSTERPLTGTDFDKERQADLQGAVDSAAEMTAENRGVNSSSERPLTRPVLDNEYEESNRRTQDYPAETIAENRGVNSLNERSFTGSDLHNERQAPTRLARDSPTEMMTENRGVDSSTEGPRTGSDLHNECQESLQRTWVSPSVLSSSDRGMQDSVQPTADHTFDGPGQISLDNQAMNHSEVHLNDSDDEEDVREVSCEPVDMGLRLNIIPYEQGRTPPPTQVDDDEIYPNQSHGSNEYEDEVINMGGTRIHTQELLNSEGIFTDIHGIDRGCIKIYLGQMDLQSLKQYCEKYKTGRLREMFESLYISEDMRQRAASSGKALSLTLHINIEELEGLIQMLETLSKASSDTERTEVSDIWVTYCAARKTWFWTPYKENHIWMKASHTKVLSGPLKDHQPSLRNIHFLTAGKVRDRKEHGQCIICNLVRQGHVTYHATKNLDGGPKDRELALPSTTIPEEASVSPLFTDKEETTKQKQQSTNSKRKVRDGDNTSGNRSKFGIIYSCDLQKREECMLTTLEALINDARELFGYGEDENLSVFLESKGAMVSTEEKFRVITEETGTVELIIVNQTRGEAWSPAEVPSRLPYPNIQTINQSQNVQRGDSNRFLKTDCTRGVDDVQDDMSVQAENTEDISMLSDPLCRLNTLIAQPKLRYELDRIARQVDREKVLEYRNENGFNVLHAAAFHNNEDAVITIWRHFDWATLSTQVTSDNQPGELEGSTAKEIAVKKHHKCVANHIDLLEKIESEMKPIHKTVKSRNIYELKQLCTRGQSMVNITGPGNSTPLHIAAGIGFLDGVKLLFEMGADLNAVTEYGETALGRACRMGFDDVVEYLTHLPDIDIKKNEHSGLGYITCLDAAAEGNFRDIYNRLQSHGLPVTSNALVCVARGGHVELVKEIAAMDGIDVNYQNKFGNTAMCEASRYGNVDVVRYLINEHRIDPNIRNKYGSTALRMAVLNTVNMDVVESLLAEGGADPTILNNEGENSAHVAASSGQVQCLDAILRAHPGLINKRGNLYKGSLVYLVRGNDRGRPVWRYVLVKRKLFADFLVKANGGSLDVADYGKVLYSGWGKDPPDDIVKKIQETHVTYADSAVEDLTPLHHAVLEQNPAVVEKLLELGAATDVRDAYKLTPLHLACMRGNLEIVKLLVDAGANTNAADDDGDTPLDVAKFNYQGLSVAFLVMADIEKLARQPVKEVIYSPDHGLDTDVTVDTLKTNFREIREPILAATTDPKEAPVSPFFRNKEETTYSTLTWPKRAIKPVGTPFYHHPLRSSEISKKGTKPVYQHPLTSSEHSISSKRKVRIDDNTTVKRSKFGERLFAKASRQKEVPVSPYFRNKKETTDSTLTWDVMDTIPVESSFHQLLRNSKKVTNNKQKVMDDDDTTVEISFLDRYGVVECDYGGVVSFDTAKLTTVESKKGEKVMVACPWPIEEDPNAECNRVGVSTSRALTFPVTTNPEEASVFPLFRDKEETADSTLTWPKRAIIPVGTPFYHHPLRSSDISKKGTIPVYQHPLTSEHSISSKRKVKIDDNTTVERLKFGKPLFAIASRQKEAPVSPYFRNKKETTDSTLTWDKNGTIPFESSFHQHSLRISKKSTISKRKVRDDDNTTVEQSFLAESRRKEASVSPYLRNKTCDKRGTISVESSFHQHSLRSSKTSTNSKQKVRDDDDTTVER